MQDFRNPQLTTTARARRFIGTAAEDAFELRPGGEMLDTPRSSDPFLIAQRGTPRRASDSRDRFAELRAELRGKARQGDPYALRGSAETEVHRYDQPDSVLDFDYHMERFRLVLQRELAAGLTFSLGPQAELLSAPWTPAERYTELGGRGGIRAALALALVVVRARRRPAHLRELGIRRHDRPGAGLARLLLLAGPP